ncbi:multinuclear nonheme iron-dependent oxidase [Portibacter marinus]|uniref:multinuclear nonheme iron-dependent oxidase n=1 Tax=Portibacter marinus TaxID=2898660 RepID=UPI001F2978F7|nr:DUF692 family multinuclear iron-containing protein [Portibacter marinus]
MRNGVGKELYSGISCNLDSNILSACFPLFKGGEVEVIEWSFDTLFSHNNLPDWFDHLLTVFGEEGRLIGHGVYFSLFNGTFTKDQQEWLNGLRVTSDRYEFDHISEHFGFMTGQDFHKGAPLNVPLSDNSLAIARDRISRMSYACGKPVGLENLAFCYDKEGLIRQGSFINQILEEVNGFLILDLHNLYCQCMNFDIEFSELILKYPLDRVREIHISGGSWEIAQSEDRKIRRDTHDDAVPREVFEYLQEVIPKLPNLKFVILEQLGTGLDTIVKQARFRDDFETMKSIVDHKQLEKPLATNDFKSKNLKLSKHPISDETLAKQQQELTFILENSVDFRSVKKRLQNSSLASSPWNIESWEDSMLETAFAIANKWKSGF